MADVLTKGMEIPTRYIDAMKIPYHFDLNAELWANKDEIDKVPTVSPDEVRGVGKWIERVDYDWDIYYECSVCHTPFTMLDGTTPELNDYHYCPNCGAKMEVSEDE